MEQLIQQNIWIILLLTVWQIPWKGWALWRAAKLGSKRWFVVLLLVQTLAVLDILYIFVFSKQESPTN